MVLHVIWQTVWSGANFLSVYLYFDFSHKYHVQRRKLFVNIVKGETTKVSNFYIHYTYCIKIPLLIILRGTRHFTFRRQYIRITGYYSKKRTSIHLSQYALSRTYIHWPKKVSSPCPRKISRHANLSQSSVKKTRDMTQQHWFKNRLKDHPEHKKILFCVP